MVTSRLNLIHGDAFEAVAMLNNRLEFLGEDAYSGLHAGGSVTASIANVEQLEEAQLCTQLGSNDFPGENPPPSNELGAREGAKPARHERDDAPDGTREEMRLISALECVPSLLQSINISEIRSHISELNYCADRLMAIFKPVISR